MNKKDRLAKGLLKIGELAKEAGVPSSTIRHYTDIGLLKVIAHTQGGYRLYDRDTALNIVRRIKPVFDRRRTLRELKKAFEKSMDKSIS